LPATGRAWRNQPGLHGHDCTAVAADDSVLSKTRGINAGGGCLETQLSHGGAERPEPPNSLTQAAKSDWMVTFGYQLGLPLIADRASDDPDHLKKK
jgi:hypothetical protein